MNQQEFEHIINNNDYHFFIFSCPAVIPFHLACHTWLVIKSPGGDSVRWDLCYTKNKKYPSLGYLHKNILPAWKGISKYFWETAEHFQSSLLYHCAGNGDSLSYKIISFIEDYVEQYPYKGEYRLIWHNSNHFTEWIVKQFPEMKFALPWNAIGK